MAVNVYAPLAMAEAFQASVAASAQKKIVSMASRFASTVATPTAAG
jgi:hypothetical protein